MARVGAIILAAGQASRYRAQDASVASKVLAVLDGKALVRHVAEAALASRVDPVIVVTGNAHEDVRAALSGLAVDFRHNAHFAEGMAGSLKTGVAALGEDCDGVVVLLADMPRIDAPTINQLAAAIEAQPDADAVVPLYQGQRGNPVLLARSLFGDIARLSGDEGARRLLRRDGLKIVEIEAPEHVTLDIDTPDALKGAANS